MIVIDMDMPKCCGTCRMSETDVCKEWTNLKGYEMGQKRADFCPIVCTIEDIKAEIIQMNSLDYVEPISCEEVIEIIDKHIG